MMSANMRIRVGALVAVCGLAGGLVGCSSGGSHGADAGVGFRPLVDRSAIEASQPSDTTGLAFFDELEGKPLASQDDAIHSMLLLGTGTSAPSYEQRVAMAKELGYVERGFDRPGRQAVTMGDVAEMASKILEGKRPATSDEAMAKMVHREIAPASARPNQGLTGAQLVSMAGGVRDAMSLEGVGRVPAPRVWEVMGQVENVKPAASVPAPTAVAQVEAAPSPAPAPAHAPAVVVATAPKPASVARTEPVLPEPLVSTAPNSAKPESRKPVTVVATVPGAAGLNPMAGGMAASNLPPALGGKGRAEPLPEIPVGTPAPAIDLQDPNAKGSVIGPDEKVFTPGQPKSTDATRVTPTKPTPKKAPPKVEKAATPPPPPTPPVKKDDAKKPTENEWTAGQPLKKPTSPDEPK